MPLIVVRAMPKSLNAYRKEHWYARAAEQKRWADLVGKHALFAEPVPGPCRVELTFFWHDRTRRDPDNYSKCVLDGVKSAGLIRDDGPPWLVELVLRSRWDKDDPRTEILYESVPEPAWPLVTKRKSPSVYIPDGL